MSAKKKRSVSKDTGNQYQPISAPLPPGAPVLFVHPSKQGQHYRPGTDVGRPYGLIPVGFPAIANLLRQNGVAVKGVNHAFEVGLNANFNLRNWLLAQRDARVILIDLHWYEHCFGAIQVAKLCKQVFPQAWVVLGGLSASGFAREILANFPEVDLIVRGDGESPVLALVQHLLSAASPQDGLDLIPNLSYRKAGGIVENPIHYTAETLDLDQLDFVDLDFMEHGKEYGAHEYIVTNLDQAHRAMENNPFLGRWLTTARGCKYECAYCGGCKSAHKILAGRNGLVLRSPEKVVDDLERLQQLGYVQASLTYDIAELGEEYWQELFSQMRQRNVHISLYNEFFQLPSAEFIEAMADVVIPEHSCVALSPLVGNERVRRLNGKQFSNEQFFDVLDMLQQKHMYLFAYFSLNLPGETNATFKETLSLAEDIYYFYPNSLLKIINSVHTMDPLAPMNARASAYGINSTMSTFMDFYRYCEQTLYHNPDARNGLHRGFDLLDPSARSLQQMADDWDQLRNGKEACWWPLPPGW